VTEGGQDRDSEMHVRFAKSDQGREKEVGFVTIFTNFVRLRCKKIFTK
jgi:hypothetical protein